MNSKIIENLKHLRREKESENQLKVSLASCAIPYYFFWDRDKALSPSQL